MYGCAVRRRTCAGAAATPCGVGPRCGAPGSGRPPRGWGSSGVNGACRDDADLRGEDVLDGVAACDMVDVQNVALEEAPIPRLARGHSSADQELELVCALALTAHRGHQDQDRTGSIYAQTRNSLVARGR